MQSNRSVGRTTAPRFRHAQVAAATFAMLGLVVTGTAVRADAAEPCPGATGLPVSAKMTNGDIKVGFLANSSGNSVTACGGAAASGGQNLAVTIPKGNISIPSNPFKVLFLEFPTQLTLLSDMSGPASIDSAGAYHVSLKGTLQAKTTIFGMDCLIGPFDLTLTTEKSGSLTGTPLVLDSASGTNKGKLVTGDFVMPAISESSTCISFISGIANMILGLPNQPGGSTASYDTEVKIG